MDFLLTVITFVPLIGVVLILLLPTDQEKTIKQMATGISFVPLLLAIYLWFAYDKGVGGIQFETLSEWIPAINVNYHMGVDGLSIPLVFLTALLTALSMIYSSYTITSRVKEFFILFLIGITLPARQILAPKV